MEDRKLEMRHWGWVIKGGRLVKYRQKTGRKRNPVGRDSSMKGGGGVPGAAAMRSKVQKELAAIGCVIQGRAAQSP